MLLGGFSSYVHTVLSINLSKHLYATRSSQMYTLIIFIVTSVNQEEANKNGQSTLAHEASKGYKFSMESACATGTKTGTVRYTGSICSS